MRAFIHKMPGRFGALFFLLHLLAGLQPAAAVHLVGGEMSYRFLDTDGPADTPWRYEITVKVYVNPLTDPAYSELPIQVYNFDHRYGRSYNVPRTSLTAITVPTLPGCGQTAPPVSLALYVLRVNLPPEIAGYTATFSLGQRVAGITNLEKSVTLAMWQEVHMQPPTLLNSSPVFTDIPLAMICLGTDTFVANTAYDADGDELEYSLATVFPPGNYTSPYAAGYSPSQPFGPTGQVQVDPATGVSRYLNSAQGIYQMGIEVKEYRRINGVRQLLGSVHRDMQVVVRQCTGAPGLPPVFTPATLAQRDFQLREGQSLAFDVGATDPDGHPLTLMASSPLLDGPGGIEASFGGLAGTSIAGNPVGQASIRGVGSAAGTFRLSGCGMDRRVPYDLLLTATDEVCNSQTAAITMHITVVRPEYAGGSLQGSSRVCAQSVATYTVSPGLSSGPYHWSVQGGVLLNPSTSTTATVVWGRQGSGTVRVAGSTDTGCPTRSLEYPVAIEAGLPVTGPTAYCLAAASGLTYTVGQTSSTYIWSISNGTIVSGQNTASVVVDVVPGATALLQVAAPNSTSCIGAVRIAPDDNCLAFYNIITPNGDQQNERFIIKNIERHPQTALTIFDRWGRQVFHSDDYQNTYDGAGTGPGQHYYLCRLADGTTYKGWVEIVR